VSRELVRPVGIRRPAHGFSQEPSGHSQHVHQSNWRHAPKQMLYQRQRQR
jgi:hypothetical protein